ncbi:hypothetical protein ACOMHN_026645 [Nucella lapillus]
MYAVMDRVDYSTLQVGRAVQGPASQAMPPRLEELACRAIVRSEVLMETMLSLPPHMVETLLSTAIKESNYKSIAVIIAMWPTETLCLRRMITPQQYKTFLCEPEFCKALHSGILHQRECCQMTCLDLRGLALDMRSLDLLFSLPFLCLPWEAVSDVDSMIKTMTDHCLAAAEQATFKWRGWWDQLSNEEKFLLGNLDQFCHFSGQDKADREYKEHWTEHLRTILTYVKKIWEQKRLRNLQDWRSFSWSGRRLVVKLEVLPVPLQGQVAIRHVVLQSLRMVMPVTLHFSGLDFSRQNNIWRNARGVEFWRFYKWENALWYPSIVSQHATDRPALMITRCDRHRREFYQDLGRNFRFYQSILDCQDVEMLTALSLKGLGYEEMRQLMPSLSKFHNLQALELSHCASALKQEHSGCAFCRIYTQAADTNFQRRSEFFASFQYLVRLDLNQSDLIDCLGEILVALPTPLQYLVLNGCHLSCGDLEALAGSKHVASLLEVDLSRVRGGWNIEEYWTQGFAEAVLKAVASMPCVQILNVASFKANPVNSLPPVEIGGVVKNSLKDLKVLILSNDTFILEELAELCQALSCIQTFQKVILKFSFLATDDLTTTHAEEALFQHFAKHGRSDVAVEISTP